MVGCPRGRGGPNARPCSAQYFAVAALDRVSSTPAAGCFPSDRQARQGEGSIGRLDAQGGNSSPSKRVSPGRPFNAPQFRSALEQTRRLTTSPPQEAVPAVQELWREAGVQLLFVPGTAWGGRKRLHSLALIRSRPGTGQLALEVGRHPLVHPLSRSSSRSPASSQEGLRPRASTTKTRRLPRLSLATVSSRRATGGRSSRGLGSSQRLSCKRLPRVRGSPLASSLGDCSTKSSLLARVSTTCVSGGTGPHRESAQSSVMPTRAYCAAFPHPVTSPAQLSTRSAMRRRGTELWLIPTATAPSKPDTTARC